jgi:transcription factor IIIB subunit 2
MKCKRCGSSNITRDEEQGEAICECGNVIERSGIVNAVDFSNSGNKSSVYGSFFDKNAPNSGFFGGNKNLLSESGQVRLYKAYKLIEQIASKLSLPKTLAESAKKLYKIAKLDFDKNFVQGRQTKHVAAVVLYIVCRLEQKPHLLIDFADVLQTSLYSLGSTYLKLIKKIKNNMNKLDLPLIDPSLFIHRFCAKLNFENKTQTVATTALRMLQSMKRDWISTGRRPAGLCGAAILISARYHGFTRSTHQIVKVVKVCHETIRKRLQEFKKTSVAQLTMEEFEAIKDVDLQENDKYGMDPPAFIRNMLKRNKAIKSIGDVDNQMSIA